MILNMTLQLKSYLEKEKKQFFKSKSMANILKQKYFFFFR